MFYSYRSGKFLKICSKRAIKTKVKLIVL